MTLPFFGKRAGKDRSAWIDCLLLALVTFLPYAQVVTHRFVELDDAVYVHSNIHVVEGFTFNSVVWAFSALELSVGNWHPITWLSIFLDRELFGPYVGGYLLMNVGWHIAAACSCYLAFRAVTGRRFWAAVIACFFALHPANVENVAWYSERKSILDALFWFLGIWAYVSCLRTGKRVWLGVVMVTHLLGLMSKPMHVTFPCTLILAEVMYHGFRGSLTGFWRPILQSGRRVWPLFLCSAYGSCVTLLAQAYAMQSSELYPLGARLLNILISYGEYLRMFFLPNDFSPFYPLFIQDLVWSRGVLPMLALAGISGGLLWAGKRTIVLACGWLWFLGVMVPAVGLVHVGSQSYADRYLYIPMVGLSFLLPYLVDRLASLHGRMLKLFQGGILIVMGGALAIHTDCQVYYWRSGTVLYKHAWEVGGPCMMTLNLRLSAYGNEGRYAEGNALAQEQLALMKNPAKRAEILLRYAKGLSALDDTAGAITALREVIKLYGVSGCYEGDREPLILLGALLAKQGDLDEARQLLDKASSIRSNPTQADWFRRNEEMALDALRMTTKKPQP